MRHPITLSAVVLGVLFLSLVALLHLLAVRRTNGHRLLWAAVSLFVPVLGPVLYFLLGRNAGQLEDEEEAYVPAPYVAPAQASDLPHIRPAYVRTARLPPLPPEPESGTAPGGPRK